jgi:DNA helicase-2/ATP-dependent DNA helicase PcrA
MHLLTARATMKRMFDLGWDSGLDDAQLAAATHGDSPLVIMAGAGTGKTRTLTARVASLIDRGIPPERILLLTFTRRSADDMLTRAAAMCTQPEAARRLQGGTFHAVAHQLVSRNTGALGLPGDMSVLDRADSADAMDLLRHDHGLAEKDSRMPNPSALIDLYSRAVSTGTPARKLITTDFPWLETHADSIVGLFRAYVTRKRERGMLDFDDLLLAWRSLLVDPIMGPEIAGRWDHVLVDEYQDVNQTQVDIVLGLKPNGRGLTVVGDDAQAIYGFRGSDSDHLRHLSAAFDDCVVIRLERNFRSRQKLLDLANTVRPSSSGHRLQLHSQREGGRRASLVRCHDAPAEARAIADAVLAAVADGRKLRDQAVLMRTGHHSDLLEIELSARNIPYVKFGGLKFLEAAHVKDLVATLRVTSNRVDEVAWYRLLRLHDGIGPASARNLVDTVAAADLSGDWVAQAVARAPAMSRVGLTATLDGIAAARAVPQVAGRAAQCLRTLHPLITARYADSLARLGDLERLVAAASLAPDLATFVAELTLDPPASTSDLAGPPHLDDDYLVLSTVHSAKGLEWPVVHVMHLVDGAFPSDMALTSNGGLLEEQRLFYVAVTRAADELFLYAPLRMPHHRFGRDDKHSFAQICRFIDADALQTLDVTEVVPVRAAQPPVLGQLARVALPALDDLWA